jgi:hypothetical protein
MAFSLFPDPRSAQPSPIAHQTVHQITHQISVFLWGILGCGLFLLFLKVGTQQNPGFSEPIVDQQEIFQSLPPQVLEFSLRGASY